MTDQNLAGSLIILMKSYSIISYGKNYHLETPGVSPNAALLSMTQQRIPANWLIHLFTV